MTKQEALQRALAMSKNGKAAVTEDASQFTEGGTTYFSESVFVHVDGKCWTAATYEEAFAMADKELQNN